MLPDVAPSQGSPLEARECAQNPWPFQSRSSVGWVENRATREKTLLEVVRYVKGRCCLVDTKFNTLGQKISSQVQGIYVGPPSRHPGADANKVPAGTNKVGARAYK